jgi:hypothetical protein
MPSTLLPFLQAGIGNGPWIPTPNSVVPGANFFFDDVRRYRGNQVIVRGDQKLGDGSFLYGRYAFNDGDRKNPNLNPNWIRLHRLRVIFCWWHSHRRRGDDLRWGKCVLRISESRCRRIELHLH